MGDMTYLQGGGKAPWRAVGDSQAKPSLIGNEFHGDLVMMSALEYECCLSHSGTFSSMTWRFFSPSVPLIRGENTVYSFPYLIDVSEKEKIRKKLLPLRYAFESFKLFVVSGQRISLFTVSDRKRSFHLGYILGKV